MCTSEMPAIRQKWQRLFAGIVSEFARDGCEHVSDVEIAAFGALIKHAAKDIAAKEKAIAALKPDTGELVDYVEFYDGTSLIGEEATAFYKGMACLHCGYRHPPDGMCV